ncbi:hypothetical protein [Mumia sp. DW29H23]|uniref:hypothetical protein n=1 Tax=Mumia sp. DW29H23 TaxID=3421241 RepID=UPI003D69C07F
MPTSSASLSPKALAEMTSGWSIAVSIAASSRSALYRQRTKLTFSGGGASSAQATAAAGASPVNATSR